MKTIRIFASLVSIAVTLASAGCGGAADEKREVSPQKEMRSPVPDSLSIRDFTRAKSGWAAAAFKASNADFSESRYTLGLFNVLAMEKDAIISAAKNELAKGKSVLLDSDGSEAGQELVKEISLAVANGGAKMPAVILTELEAGVFATTPVNVSKPAEVGQSSVASHINRDNKDRMNSINQLFPQLGVGQQYVQN